MKKILILGTLFGFVSLAIAHGGGQDSQGGHFDTSDNTYHCHAPSGCVGLDPFAGASIPFPRQWDDLEVLKENYRKEREGLRGQRF